MRHVKLTASIPEDEVVSLWKQRPRVCRSSSSLIPLSRVVLNMKGGSGTGEGRDQCCSTGLIRRQAPKISVGYTALDDNAVHDATFCIVLDRVMHD